MVLAYYRIKSTDLLQVSSQQKLLIVQSWRTTGSVGYTSDLSKFQSSPMTNEQPRCESIMACRLPTALQIRLKSKTVIIGHVGLHTADNHIWFSSVMDADCSNAWIHNLDNRHFVGKVFTNKDGGTPKRTTT